MSFTYWLNTYFCFFFKSTDFIKYFLLFLPERLFGVISQQPWSCRIPPADHRALWQPLHIANGNNPYMNRWLWMLDLLRGAKGLLREVWWSYLGTVKRPKLGISKCVTNYPWAYYLKIIGTTVSIAQSCLMLAVNFYSCFCAGTKQNPEEVKHHHVVSQTSTNVWLFSGHFPSLKKLSVGG